MGTPPKPLLRRAGLIYLLWALYWGWVLARLLSSGSPAAIWQAVTAPPYRDLLVVCNVLTLLVASGLAAHLLLRRQLTTDLRRPLLLACLPLLVLLPLVGQELYRGLSDGSFSTLSGTGRRYPLNTLRLVAYLLPAYLLLRARRRSS